MMAKKGKKKSGSNTQASSSMVIYRGPIATRTQQPQEMRIPLKISYATQSTSASFIEMSVHTGMVSSTSEWGSFASLWREYRVLGIRWEYAPAYDRSGSNRTNALGAVVTYHGPPPAWAGAVTTSSFNSTWLMEGATPFHPGEHRVLEWRMGDVEEAQFFSTSQSYSLGGIYATTAGSVSASSYFGQQFVTFLVQFKGRV